MLIRCPNCKQDYLLSSAEKIQTFHELLDGQSQDDMKHWDATCPLCLHEYELSVPKIMLRR